MKCRFCGQNVSSLIAHKYAQEVAAYMRALAALPRRSLVGTAVAKERAQKALNARWAKVRAEKAAAAIRAKT